MPAKLIQISSYQEENFTPYMSKKFNPVSFDLNIIDRCNSYCRFCSIWKNKTPDLELKYIKKFLIGIKDWVKGDIVVNLVGGEPTYRNDLTDVLFFSRDIGVPVVMTTNGYRLADYDYAKSLVSTGLDKIVISVEGFQKTNDYLRGKNSFKKIIQGIKNLRKLKKDITIRIQSIICGKNINELPQFVNFMYKMGYGNNFNFQALTSDFTIPLEKRKKNWYINDKLWPKNHEELCKNIDKLILMKKLNHNMIIPEVSKLEFWKVYFENPNRFENVIKCNIGDIHIQCDGNGGISLCPHMPPVGNLKNNTVEEIFFSNKADERREYIYTCKEPCNFQINCRYEKLRIKENN
ncbi:MAG: radical SAM protein [Nanoarchaeota archaeon]